MTCESMSSFMGRSFRVMGGSRCPFYPDGMALPKVSPATTAQPEKEAA